MPGSNGVFAVPGIFDGVAVVYISGDFLDAQFKLKQVSRNQRFTIYLRNDHGNNRLTGGKRTEVVCRSILSVGKRIDWAFGHYRA
jgi:hypothetical protein